VSRASRIRRDVGLALGWTGIGFVLAILLAAAAPMTIGAHSYVVRSGSMAPAIDTGDVVVVETIEPRTAAIGDIVTFDEPGGAGRVLSHRVRAIAPAPAPGHPFGEVLSFTTQGDANTTVEHWNVEADGAIGRVVYRIPLIGHAISEMTTPVGRIALVLVPALLLGISLLRRIWRPAGIERGGGEHAA
jgi:signal peptidase